MKAFKAIGYIVAGLLAVIVLGVGAVALFFDPNEHKADIERLVEEKIHRKLVLQGDLKLSFFPWLAVNLGAAQLGERSGFGDQPFVSFEEARLSIRLLPLMRGDIEIGDILVKKPSIRLITDERGRHNWSDLAEGEAQADASTSRPKQDGVRTSVAGLEIRNGAVVIDDRKEKSRTSIRDFTLTTGNISSARPFALHVAFVVDTAGQPATPYEVDAKATADFDKQQYRLDDFAFDTTWHGDGKEKSVPVALRAKSMSLDTRQQTFALQALELSFANAKLTGEVSGKELFDAPQIVGQIDLAPLSPRDLMRNLGIDAPVTRDADVLKRLGLRAQIQATKNSVAMQKVQMKLDDTTATGELAVVDFASSALRFDLNLDRIDFDRYLPPPAEGKAAPADAAKESPPTPIPVEMLRALNARGDLKIGDAKFSGMKLSKLHLGVNARDGDVRLAPTDAAIYGGEYHGSMSIDASGKVPKLTLESRASNVDFAPLFKDMFDTQKVAGRGTANVKATAVGIDTLTMQKSLSGTVDFNVTNGAFEGTDLWYEIRRARALLHREAVPERTGQARTAFTSCKGTGVMQNGVLTNNDLDVAAQYLKVGGQGSVDIVKSTLEYKLNVQVLRMTDTEAGASDLVDAQIPVKISGPLASPSVKPDLEGMVKARAKQELEKQKDKVREKVQDKLQDLFRG